MFSVTVLDVLFVASMLEKTCFCPFFKSLYSPLFQPLFLFSIRIFYGVGHSIANNTLLPHDIP